MSLVAKKGTDGSQTPVEQGVRKDRADSRRSLAQPFAHAPFYAPFVRIVARRRVRIIISSLEGTDSNLYGAFPVK